MISSKGKIKGLVTVTVRDCNGHVKYFKNGFWRRLLNLPERPMIFKHHNTITNQGDGMIADLMISNPTLTKVDATNGYMRVGTGWTGTTPKNNTGVNTATGSFKKLDSTYPKTQAAFGSSGQNEAPHKVPRSSEQHQFRQLLPHERIRPHDRFCFQVSCHS